MQFSLRLSAVLLIPLSAAASGGDRCANLHRKICTASIDSGRTGEERAKALDSEIRRTRTDSSEAEIIDEFVKRVYGVQNEKLLTENFALARDVLGQWILNTPDGVIPRKDKEDLLHRLNRVRLELPQNALYYNDMPGMLLKNDIVYRRHANGDLMLRVGGGYLLEMPTRENVIFTMAHELSHAIDSCERPATRAFSKLSACLAGQLKQKKLFCRSGSSVPEAFADWLGTEVLAHSLRRPGSTQSTVELLDGALKDLCRKSQGTAPTHPEPRFRIEAIVGNHPGIRKLLGCAPALRAGFRCSLSR